MINFNHAWYFDRVAAEGSIARAAQSLSVAPSTISEQLREFERTRDGLEAAVAFVERVGVQGFLLNAALMATIEAKVPAYAARRMVYRGELPAVRRGPRGHWQLPLSVVERLRELYTLQANEAFVATA